MSHEEDREQTSSQVSALPSQSEVREEPVYTRWPTCGFWWRAVAHSFDTAVISTITSVGFLLFLFMFGESFFQEIITQAQNSGGEAENNLSGMQVAFSTLGSFLSVALLLLYGVGSEGSSRSATPGKLLMGLRVATEDGQPLLYSDAFVRNLYKHLLLVVGGVLGLVIAPLSLSSPLLGGIVAIVTAIALILLFIYTIIDPLLAVFSSKNQTLHDRWSYSIVVKKPGVNRWLRLLLTLFAIFLLFAGQATLVTAIAFSQLQNLTPKYMEQFEMNAEGMDFSDTDPFGGAPLPRGGSGIDTTGTLSISERIAQELERAKQAAEETSDQEKNTPEGNSETPGNSILPKEEEKRDEFTPQVDGLSVLQRQTSTGALRPKATPIRERFTGAIEVNGRKFVVRDVYAALSSNRQVIVLNIYDEPLSPQRRSAFHSNFRAALEDTAPILRFKLLFSSYGSGCHDGALKKYIIDVNAKKAALRYKKRFFSFSRGGNQILTKEFVLFDCKRKPGGFLSAELRGTAGFLIGGVRIPVIWNTDAVIQFPDKA